ncbi:hypothetical protein BO78DRAFT_88596 [Aspergillus sclerotiicarbonarius CBS 121057]|uniref:Uncharacterized protein n=1 Tax=Aspergillus sclerotiicarbonarius (strain CBS 121057 / IBT 28362) TaxID=1448318 RepID=A0A319FJA1_ASPSB|nr:hypothetical protein BO78DRAFT_88596 [Aspergillus sclerotiicarbonarius CBS 121057]
MSTSTPYSRRISTACTWPFEAHKCSAVIPLSTSRTSLSGVEGMSVPGLGRLWVKSPSCISTALCALKMFLSLALWTVFQPVPGTGLFCRLIHEQSVTLGPLQIGQERFPGLSHWLRRIVCAPR